MRRTPTPVVKVLAGTALAVGTAAAGLVATPSSASAFTVSFTCESVPDDEVVLSWDDVTYELTGTCGVVRITADRADVTMPTARRLVVEGQDAVVESKSLAALEVTGGGNRVHSTSVQELSQAGTGNTVAVDGLLEEATVTGTDAVLGADVVHTLRLRSTGGAVTARRAYVVRIPGDVNTAGLTRAERVVLGGDGNRVTVARGRTVVRDRGEDNAVRVHRRR